MRVRPRRVGEVLYLERRPIDVSPFETYKEIGIRSFGKGIFHKEPISGPDLGSKRVFEICPGDLVLSNVFAWEGAVALAGETEQGCIGSHRFMTYVARSADVDLAYLRYFFTSETGITLLNQASPGSAGRNKTLAIDRFEALEIPIPDIDDQRRVAAKLNRHATLARRVAELDLRSVSLCTALRSALLASESRQIPFGEVLALQRDEVAVDPVATYCMAGVLSFGKGLYLREPVVGAEVRYIKLNRIHEGQFVLARLNGWEGGMAVVTREFDGMHMSQEFPVFDIDTTRAFPGYVASLCQWPPLWDSLMQRSRGLGARTGARRLRVHPEQLREVEVPLPGMDTQRRIARLEERISGVLGAIERRREHVGALGISGLNQIFEDLL